MTATCDRCQISCWHPEARSCTLADCALRLPCSVDGILPRGLTLADVHSPVGQEPTASATVSPARGAGGFVNIESGQDRAGDGEPDGLRCGVESIPVHVEALAA